MSYIEFDKTQLINLEYSLHKELLRSNRAGSYASTTITGCNTRKYHGLLVTLQPQIDNQHHVFLSSFDATVIQHNTEFNLGIHKYGDDVYEPGGHKYIRDFESDPIPKLTYRIGGVILTKERVFAANDDRVLIRYTLDNAHSPTKLRFKPLLAFRSVHFLSKENDDVYKSYSEVNNGIKVKMYEPYSELFMQFSKKVAYVHQPEWHYGIEYDKEKTRGYDYKEDLYNPGYFEISIKKGESIIFSAGLNEAAPRSLKALFINEIKNRVPRDSFENCLYNAAEQFFVRNKDNKIELIAGYHWFNISARDTFIALPGLTLTQNDTNTFLKVIDTMVALRKGAFFPNNRIGSELIYNSADAPLWFFRALQQYVSFTGESDFIWKKYGKVMKEILNEFKKGTSFNIYMRNDGLLFAGGENDVLTWMNAMVEGKPVVDRNGLAVEVNALWYNAIRFFIEVAEKAGNNKIVKEWEPVAEKINVVFKETFWDSDKGYLADVVKEGYKDFSVRPNQVIVTSLPYSPVSEEIKNSILQTVEQELLTTRGLRTLSPKNPDYKGIYKGDIITRDRAYHNGSVFPWLLGHFAEGYLKLHGKGGIHFIKELYNGFEEEMNEHGIGTISELYYGDPPHRGKGAISQAWSVAELLRINYLIKQNEKNSDQS
ncbi:MAG: glycogen debranching enzyme family protein [Bacteroidetes bacterium]|nr:glycogen debranching enzyme family protein [Bacteroidota bacterium]MBL7105391.1 glycogen debranching enzyme family protein [Bacteroidales bacterium]